MMPLMHILYGKPAAHHIEELCQKRVASFSSLPTLAIVVCGDRKDSSVYIARKIECAKRIGISVKLFKFDASISEEELQRKVWECNHDTSINGIIVQLPLPTRINKKNIIDSIAPEKDVDGLTSKNQELFYGGESAFTPATARGVMSLLSFYNIPLQGKTAAVVGRSELVGKPVAFLLEKEGVSVTVCHRGTVPLEDVTCNKDILVVAAGSPRLIQRQHTHDSQVIVDVGITVLKEGEKDVLVGDVDKESVYDHVAALSPVPGGVGPMTVISLMQNVCDAYEKQSSMHDLRR